MAHRAPKLLLAAAGFCAATACEREPEVPVYHYDDPCLPVALRVDLQTKARLRDLTCARSSHATFDPREGTPRFTVGPDCDLDGDLRAEWEASVARTLPTDRPYSCRIAPHR